MVYTKMVIDITELFTVKHNIGMDKLISWLAQTVGPYIGPGTGFDREIMRKQTRRETVIYIGQGWQIVAVETLDGYGHMLKYELDITDDRLATFFILKWL